MKILWIYFKERLGLNFPKSAIAVSGTLSTPYKLRIANLVKEICTWDNMSLEARTLSTKLFDFIRASGKSR